MKHLRPRGMEFDMSGILLEDVVGRESAGGFLETKNNRFTALMKSIPGPCRVYKAPSIQFPRI